jgi:hypothetical protein
LKLHSRRRFLRHHLPPRSHPPMRRHSCVFAGVSRNCGARFFMQPVIRRPIRIRPPLRLAVSREVSDPADALYRALLLFRELESWLLRVLATALRRSSGRIHISVASGRFDLPRSTDLLSWLLRFTIELPHPRSIQSRPEFVRCIALHWIRCDPALRPALGTILVERHLCDPLLLLLAHPLCPGVVWFGRRGLAVVLLL